MHSVKRRKLDLANSTLSKPFRSPLKTTVGDNPARQGPIKDERPQMLHASTPSTLSPEQTRSPVDRKHETKVSSLSSSAPKGRPANSGTEDTLIRESTALARKLTVLRQSLDTAQQALKFESTNQSIEIATAIAKWRSVVRDTADELFQDAKQRVQDDGGVKGWLEQQQKDPPDLWFEERQVKLTEAQRKMLEIQRKDEEAEAAKYGLVEEVEEEETETTFTMARMLQQMNIDLSLVGYDKDQQRWID